MLVVDQRAFLYAFFGDGERDVLPAVRRWAWSARRVPRVQQPPAVAAGLADQVLARFPLRSIERPPSRDLCRQRRSRTLFKADRRAV